LHALLPKELQPPAYRPTSLGPLEPLFDRRAIPRCLRTCRTG
jgi:hypothetical protein